MQRMKISMKNSIPVSKGTRREILKRGEIYIDKRRIYTPMRTTTPLMTVTMKQNIFSSWVYKHKPMS